MVETADFIADCDEINAGDDTQLLILADWLEDAKDSRADGIRTIVVNNYHPAANIGADGEFLKFAEDFYWESPVWNRLSQHGEPSNAIPFPVFDKLPKNDKHYYNHLRFYKTRSAAFLALAEALTTTKKVKS